MDRTLAYKALILALRGDPLPDEFYDSLGDAEATSWTPPCESGHSSWTLDVWYLLAYDGMFGQGRSFLVDLDEERVVSVREFSLRPG